MSREKNWEEILEKEGFGVDRGAEIKQNKAIVIFLERAGSESVSEEEITDGFDIRQGI